MSYRPGSKNTKADALYQQYDTVTQKDAGNFILPPSARLATTLLWVE